MSPSDERSVPHAPLWMRPLAHRCGCLDQGAVRMSDPKGRAWTWPKGVAPTGEWRLHRPLRALARLVRGDLGFAEGYLSGDWDSPDLVALLTTLARLDEPKKGAASFSAPFRIGTRIRHARRRNSRRGSRRNIAAHYDLGNDFYAAWLDETMTYSCAHFESPEEPLAQAQLRKYDRVLDRLEARENARVLEIGSGFGGFALRAAARGLRVESLTLSAAQLAYARARAAREGYGEDRVRFHLCDYRDVLVPPRYDHVVSIEMFEAVGEAYWKRFFRLLADALVPEGRGALQIIVIDPARFASYRRRPDFIQRYVFPGGMLPTLPILHELARGVGLELVATTHHAADYARTLTRWLARFDAAWPQFARERGERFRRLWRYYLAYCTAGFQTGRIDVVQTTVRHRDRFAPA
jgi:cyclopropane-fatty-acyl-phospholipid synthase